MKCKTTVTIENRNAFAFNDYHIYFLDCVLLKVEKQHRATCEMDRKHGHNCPQLPGVCEVLLHLQWETLQQPTKHTGNTREASGKNHILPARNRYINNTLNQR